MTAKQVTYTATKFCDENHEPLDEMPDTMPEGFDPASANNRRAIRAGLVVRSYRDIAGDSEEPTETVVSDFLADLLHFCDAASVDFDEALRVAGSNYGAEVRGE